MSSTEFAYKQFVVIFSSSKHFSSSQTEVSHKLLFCQKWLLAKWKLYFCLTAYWIFYWLPDFYWHQSCNSGKIQTRFEGVLTSIQAILGVLNIMKKAFLLISLNHVVVSQLYSCYWKCRFHVSTLYFTLTINIPHWFLYVTKEMCACLCVCIFYFQI